MLKALFILKIFTFLSRLFGHLEKNRFDKKANKEFGQLVEYKVKNTFVQKSRD